MESFSLKPYIKKQILLEAEKEKLEKMPDEEFKKFEWKNWGKIDVAQQMSSWSTSPTKEDALRREITKLLKLFGNREYIVGKKAAAIYKGDIKTSSYGKVFMSMGNDTDKWAWSNSKRAFTLISPELLQGFLNGKNALYFNKQGDEFYWEAEPSATGGQTGKTTGRRKTLLSKEVDAMKYVPGVLAWAEKPDQRRKLHTWMKNAVTNPDPNSKFKLGGQKIPANIFYDENYVNAHWQHWAKNYNPELKKVEPYKPVPAQNRDFDDWKREEDAGVAAWTDKYGKTHNWKDGSVKVKMPIWDKVGSKWKPNNSGESPLEQPDMKEFIRLGGVEKGPGAMQQDADDDSNISTAMLMLSLLGFAAGPMGAGVAAKISMTMNKLTAQGIASAGLGWLGIHYAELSDEQKQDMALRGSMFVSNLRTSFQYQNDDYYDKFLNDIGDTGSLFSRMVEKNPKLTADQLVNFRRTLDVSGTLMHSEGGGNASSTIEQPGGPKGPRFTPSGAIVRDSANFMRSALDLLNEEEPIVPIDLTRGVEIMSDISASDEQIRDANSVLNAMGMTNWTFVQPKDNTKTQASGNKGASTGAGAYIDVDDDGKISVVQTQRPIRKPGEEDEGSKVVAQAEFSSQVAALQAMKTIERLGNAHGYAPDVRKIRAAVEEEVGRRGTPILDPKQLLKARNSKNWPGRKGMRTRPAPLWR